MSAHSEKAAKMKAQGSPPASLPCRLPPMMKPPKWVATDSVPSKRHTAAEPPPAPQCKRLNAQGFGFGRRPIAFRHPGNSRPSQLPGGP